MPHQRTPQRKEENINIGKIINRVLSNWYWIILSLSVAFAIAFIINYLATPVYRVHSSISIAEESPAEQIRSELPGNFVLEDFNSTKKIIGTLKSYVLADNTLKELDFQVSFYKVKKKGLIHSRVYQQEPFEVVPDSGYVNRSGIPIYVKLLSTSEYTLEIPDLEFAKTLKFGQRFAEEGFGFKVLLNERALDRMDSYMIETFYFVFNSHNDLVNHYISNLNVAQSAYSPSLLNLTIIGENPLVEATYLNKFCEVYQQQRINEKNERAAKTLKYIGEQINFIGNQLSLAEDSLQVFKFKQLVKDIRPSTDVVMEKINSLQEEKNNLQLQVKYLDYMREFVESRYDETFILPDFLGIEVNEVSALVLQINELNNNRLKYKALLKNDNASTLLLDKEIEGLKSAILHNIEAKKEATQFSISLLNERISSIHTELRVTPFSDKELLKAQKNFDFNSTIFNTLLEKQLEANLAMASTVADTKVLEEAKVENAIVISRGKEEVYTIALLIGLLLPIGLILAFELMSNKITDVNQVIAKVSVPVIGKLGHGKQNGQIPVVKNPHGLLAESFRTLRARLHYLSPELDKKVIGFTSGSSGEGKTFCSANFAAILASMNKKAVVVGLDLRKPKMHEIFDINNEVGISTYLIGRTGYAEILKTSSTENLHVIPSGPIPPNPVELLEQEKLKKLIDRLKENYDYVIIDSPPIGLVADSFIINKFVDVNLFVIRMNFTNKGVLNLIDDLKSENSLANLNVVVNDIKHGSGSYSYAYGKNYYYYYSDHKTKKKPRKVFSDKNEQ